MKMYLAIMSVMLCCCVANNCEAQERRNKDATCEQAAQCASANCQGGKCADGTKAQGENCALPDECASGNCILGNPFNGTGSQLVNQCS